ncbi:MAG: hypothetical protein MZV49_24225 [Rhodopseudomonas palustris]|nr:hypothetical protein [Rhodopseudomonas palustris]
MQTNMKFQISRDLWAWNDKCMYITGAPQTTDVAVRDGLVQIASTRRAVFGSSWDGNADPGMRINVYNYAANTNAYGGLRGLQVYVRNYSGGSISNMYGALIDCDDRGTSVVDGSVATIQTLTVAQRINTICKTKSNVLVVEDNSQGTITPTTCAGTAMVVIQSTQPVASGARASGIHFQVTGSGTGWTNAFSFQTAAGKEGFTALVNAAVKGNIDGYIKVYDVATGQTLYIALYDTVPS